MATCKDCLHVEVCKDYIKTVLDDFNDSQMCGDDCEFFRDRYRFLELPYPISEGTKLYYVFDEIDGKTTVGKDRTTVTRVCKDGFYVSGRLDSDGTYQQDDEFYSWDAIGVEYFFTFEEAERILKEIDF